MMYAIIGLVVLVCLVFVGIALGGRKQPLTKQETTEWNEAESTADSQVDAAESKATQELQAINRETETKIRVVQSSTNKQIQEDIKSKDPEKTLDDALKEWDNARGLHSLLLLITPLLWASLVVVGCSTVHGAGGSVTAPTVTIKRATWERAVVAIRTCSAEVKKQKLLRKKDQRTATVQCDRRVKQCRAATTACRKQRGVLMQKRCPGCTKWIISTTVFVITTLAAGGAALYFAFRPTVQVTGGGT